MISIDPWFVSFLVALGIGLLIGTERERRKGEGVRRAAAGLRTFALASLSGLVSATVGGVILLSAALLATTALAVLSSMAAREDDPDLSTTAWQSVAIPIEEANNHTAEDLVRALELERAYTLGLFDGIALDDFERTSVSSLFGQLTVMQWLRSFYRHDRQHSAQIRGRKSDYQPNFKTKEPNQRKARIELVARRESR